MNVVAKRAKTARSKVSKAAAANKGFERVFEKIYRLVLKIPPGRVMTYGQIARLLDDRFSPRLVGWAMHATPKDGREIPWHRVINSRGSISTGRIILEQPDLQQLLLQSEGVVFSERGQCDLSVFQWSPSKKRRPNGAEALKKTRKARSKSTASGKVLKRAAKAKSRN
jgi:methylated-DNA-protein-cysteine methyltransferase-like protein